MSAELNLLYVHGESIGYGRLGVKLAEGLRRARVDVFDHLPDDSDPLSQHLNDGQRSKVCHTACWVSVPTHARGWWEGQSPNIFTMWEATNLPESFRETLHEFDTVLVPSDQNVELFSRYHDNVKRVLLGVDPAEWSYIPRQAPTREFRFLIGGSGPRKGTDLAYKAFCRVFATWPDRGPVPVLLMKSPKRQDFAVADRVMQINGKLSPQEEVDLYSSAHVYLQPSRGEGFGLQPLQALAQGCPTILTDAHGHESFAHLGMGLGAKLAKSGYFIYGDAGDWWEPDFDELCEYMAYCYTEYDAAVAKAQDAAQVIASTMTWDHTTQQFVDALGLDRLLRSAPEPLSYHKTDRKRYLVVTNRDWTADIAGVTYHFIQGDRYYELADVKRILFEAGLLDPCCIETESGVPADTGLTEGQIAQIGAYTARNSHCPTCGQKLNTTPTRADEFMRESS